MLRLTLEHSRLPLVFRDELLDLRFGDGENLRHKGVKPVVLRRGVRLGRHADMITHMQIDDDFLRNYISTMDSLITMTRDKLIFQKLAIPFLGEDWVKKYEAARDDPKFLGETELSMADLRKMRQNVVDMLRQLQKGIRPEPKIERVN